MKTIVVGIHDIEQIETLCYLPHSWVASNDTRIVVHRSPELSTGSNCTNFDYLITTPLTVYGFYGYSADTLKAMGINFTELTRPDKLTQSLLINSCKFRDDRLEACFRPIKSFGNLADVIRKGYAFGTELADVAVIYIKSKHGARGCGKLRVDLQLVPLEHVLSKINKATKTAALKAMPGVTVFDDGEHHQNEGMDMLCGQGYFAQEAVPNIAEEWRILVSGAHIYGHKRDMSIQQGESRPNTKSSLLTELNGVPKLVSCIPEIVKYETAIYDMVNHLGIKFGSLDLFITKGDKFGFFEYSNQFGSDDYSIDFMVNFCKQAVVELIRNN